MAAPGAFWWTALSSSMRCPTLVARAVRAAVQLDTQAEPGKLRMVG
jgi:hypothetical protein